METVKDRLLHFLKAEGISNSQFARLMGVSGAYLGSMRKSMPEEKITRLMQVFPRLNRDWLVYGEGDMLLPLKEQSESPARPEYLVPLVPVEAFAGSLQDWSEGVGLKDCRQIVAPLKGAELAIHVNGDSMEPNIPNGSVLFLKKINERAFIPWGHPMVIDTENGVLVKVVEPSPEGGDFIEARSYNPKYAPVQIPQSSIYNLYRVLATFNTTLTL